MNGGLGAVTRAAGRGLGSRRLQAVIIGLVVLAATAASTMALGLLADVHSPFDHAFARQSGAQVAVTVDMSVASPAQLAAATRVSGVTAVAGPFALGSENATITIPGIPGSGTAQLTFVGRSAPSGPVDDLTLQQGHWAAAGNQAVVSVASSVPSQLGTTITVGGRPLTVVGIAESVTNTADVWVLPAEMPAIAAGGGRPAGRGQGGTAQAQLLYRFASSATSSSITADIGEIRAALPPGSVQSTADYLAVRQSEQSGVAPWVPFVVAFGVIALAISALTVVNVVGGAVVAGTTRIGVLKSIGFTPGQVVGAYMLLAGIPAVIGALAGVACGDLLAVPLDQETAQLYQVGAIGVPYWVDLAVPAAVLALTLAAASGPALRAGQMPPAVAIAAGRAPGPGRGLAAQRALGRLTRVPRPVTLGLAAPAARPGRTLVTLAAVLFGAVAVTFGTGLAISLNRAFTEISASPHLPVTVSVPSPAGPGNSAGGAGRKGKVSIGAAAGGLSAAQQQAIITAVGRQPGTLHYLSVSQDSLSVPGVSEAAGRVQFTAYGHGDPGWSGIALIAGRWYASSPAVREADVNTLFLTGTGTSVGDSFTIDSGRHAVTVRIVGELFLPSSSAAVYTSPATLSAVDPAASGVGQYAIAVQPGVGPQAYANQLQAALGGSYAIRASSKTATEVAAITTLAALLTLLIVSVAGLGVLNTVALQVRERARDIGIFKALGMTPRQALTFVACSVGITGLAAGIIAVPAGIAVHHGVVPAMVHAASSGYPPNVISVYSLPEIAALALAGLAIALAGAVAPASWAASSPTAAAIRAE